MGLICAFVSACNNSGGDTTKKNIKINKANLDNKMKKKATFAAGCFWCVEAAFNELKGVDTAISGYTGGTRPNSTYEQVCTGATGHAEAVEITFDPAIISFEELLEVFFTVHDPTQLNKQGSDIGTQYRSAIFYHDEEQKEIAEKYIALLNEEKAFPAPIVTKLEPAKEFYSAEDYHQGYFKENPTQPYCQFTVAPKLDKFRKKFQERLKK